MLSATEYTLADLGGLLALGAAVLCGPAAVASAAVTVFKGRRRPVSTLSTLLTSALTSVVVGGGSSLAFFIIRGTIEDASALILIVPAATIVALAGAVPAAFIARWLHGRVTRARTAPSDADSRAV